MLLSSFFIYMYMYFIYNNKKKTWMDCAADTAYILVLSVGQSTYGLCICKIKVFFIAIK